MKTLFALIITACIWPFSTSTMVYNALKSDSLETVESALSSLQSESENSLNKAYSGALLMKKSNFLKVPAKKVKIFKQGRKLLEKEINNYPKNIEYRFLRLTIQEHAPKVVKYNKNIVEDKSAIISNYNSLNKFLKKYIQEYAMQSSILNPSDLVD